MDALTQALIKGFFYSIPYTMYTSVMTVLAANYWLHEVLVSNWLWLLSDLMMVLIVEKQTFDLSCSQDAEYEELFQANIDFLRQLPVHDRTFRNMIAEQNSARRDGSGCEQVVYLASPAKTQLANLVPAWPQQEGLSAPAAMDLWPSGPPEQETGGSAPEGRASAGCHARSVAPVAPVVP